MLDLGKIWGCGEMPSVMRRGDFQCPWATLMAASSICNASAAWSWVSHGSPSVARAADAYALAMYYATGRRRFAVAVRDMIAACNPNRSVRRRQPHCFSPQCSCVIRRRSRTRLRALRPTGRAQTMRRRRWASELPPLPAYRGYDRGDGKNKPIAVAVEHHHAFDLQPALRSIALRAVDDLMLADSVWRDRSPHVVCPPIQKVVNFQFDDLGCIGLIGFFSYTLFRRCGR